MNIYLRAATVIIQLKLEIGCILKLVAGLRQKYFVPIITAYKKDALISKPSYKFGFGTL